VLKGADMPIEERLLLLRGTGHDKAPPAVRQPHDKDLHRLLPPCIDRDRFSPINLGVLARLKLQRQTECGRLVRLVPLADRQDDVRHRAVAPQIGMDAALHDAEDPMPRPRRECGA